MLQTLAHSHFGSSIARPFIFKLDAKREVGIGAGLLLIAVLGGRRFTFAVRFRMRCEKGSVRERNSRDGPSCECVSFGWEHSVDVVEAGRTPH